MTKPTLDWFVGTLPQKAEYQPPGIDYPNVRLCMDNLLRCFVKGCPEYGPRHTVESDHRHLDRDKANDV